jgi:HAD superfamily hydrolase (TIGR01509 family)
VHEVKVISFDLDDTLWPVGPVIMRAEHAMLAFLAEHYPRVTAAYDLEAMRAVRVRIAFEHPDMRHDFTFLRLAALRFHAREAGYPAAMAEEAFEVFYRARNQVELYEDVRPALARLGTRFSLFTVSNGNADLAAVGIADFFRGRIAARDAGALKPDSRIFQRLIELSGVAPGEILHVGDDPEADIDGARNAGMAVAWLNRSGAAWPGEWPRPALCVRTLEELVRHVGA